MKIVKYHEKNQGVSAGFALMYVSMHSTPTEISESISRNKIYFETPKVVLSGNVRAKIWKSRKSSQSIRFFHTGSN